MPNDEADYTVFGGFKTTSHFDRATHEPFPADERIAQALADRMSNQAVADEFEAEKRAKRATVMLLDLRADIEDMVSHDAQAPAQDVLRWMEEQVASLLEILNT